MKHTGLSNKLLIDKIKYILIKQGFTSCKDLVNLSYSMNPKALLNIFGEKIKIDLSFKDTSICTKDIQCLIIKQGEKINDLYKLNSLIWTCSLDTDRRYVVLLYNDKKDIKNDKLNKFIDYINISSLNVNIDFLHNINNYIYLINLINE